MNWLETIRTGLQAVRSHRLRSGLTVLGILIGIATVVLSVGLGEGAQTSVSSQINALGSNLLIVSPGSTTSTTGIRGGLGSASTLTMQDATALSSAVAAPDISGVAPTKSTSEELDFGSTNWTTSVVGTTADWLHVRARSLSSGRFITDADNAAAADVAVLGPTTASELFGRLDPVGQSVTINSIPFTVIGVLKSAGSDSSTNLDDQAIVHHLRCLPGGPGDPGLPARDRGDDGGLHPHHPGLTAHHGHLGGQDPHRAARRYRGAVAAGRRHRRHEHHARLGDREDP